MKLLIWRWLPLVVAFAIAISSGCRSSKQAEADVLPVRIAFTNIPLSYLPVLLGESLGFYKKQGLSVTIDNFSSGAKTMEALLGHSADIGSGSFDQLMQINAEGRRVRSFFLMTRQPSRAVVLPPKSKRRIQRIEDMKGAQVGVGGFGSITHLFLQYLLAKHAIPPDDVKIASIGTGSSAIAAIEHQAVDAAVVSGSDRAVISKRVPGAVTLVDATSPEGCREVYGVDVYPSAIIFATDSWLLENPEAARRTARAARESLAWITNHTAEQIWAAIPKRYQMERDLDLEILRGVLPTYSRDGMMPRDGAEAVLKAMSVTSDKIRSAKLDLVSTYTNEFLPKP